MRVMYLYVSEEIFPYAGVGMFSHCVTDRPQGERMDQPTDRVTYRVTGTQLKTMPVKEKERE